MRQPHPPSDRWWTSDSDGVIDDVKLGLGLVMIAMMLCPRQRQRLVFRTLWVDAASSSVGLEVYWR